MFPCTSSIFCYILFTTSNKRENYETISNKSFMIYENNENIITLRKKPVIAERTFFILTSQRLNVKSRCENSISQIHRIKKQYVSRSKFHNSSSA